ncbi:MAG: hypothetical protein E6Q93_03700 [Burkholderiaceae bacterium]|nr:MAG: hypothetical protein E6Q93_03700 [Burkholderiaceae bacterium]
MKPAPLQLLQVIFRKVSVEVDERHAPEEPPNPFTSIFVFDGVKITTECGIGELDPDHERGRLYLVTLRVVIDNQAEGDAPEGKYSPYLIDVEARGVVVIPKGAERLAPPEDLAAVNGTSLLWSAVREQVLLLTSRMQAGPVMLPTMNFHDLKQGENSHGSAVPAAKHVKSGKTRGT